MCLTPQVRSSLSDTDNRNIEVLVKEAEERHDAHQAAALSHPVFQNSKLTTVRQYGNQPTASTTTDNDTQTAGHFISWYHISVMVTTPGSAPKAASISQKTV